MPGDVNCFSYLFTSLMYDSGYTSPGDSETLVSYILSNFGPERCIVTSLGKFDL